MKTKADWLTATGICRLNQNILALSYQIRFGFHQGLSERQLLGEVVMLLQAESEARAL
ncbi:hypothetical protein [uncultured Anaerovibrio sp.]|uniref:hypothetical protein n=1 Tax=uncultured Anaerovibrio sp. TaxID=361586 RepID=UPI0026068A13|nr:hypothetical protein [uncultured Anaerovibrio sp.]